MSECWAVRDRLTRPRVTEAKANTAQHSQRWIPQKLTDANQ